MNMPPGGIPPAQFCDALNGAPGAPPAKSANVASPVLVIATDCATPVVPTATLPKFSDSGVAQSPGPSGPWPSSSIENMPVFVNTVEVAVAKPSSVGLKVYWNWQLAPGATPPAQF